MHSQNVPIPREYDELWRFHAWNLSEIGPSLNWSPSDPSKIPPPYKIIDYNLLMEIAVRIIIALKIACRYDLFEPDVAKLTVEIYLQKMAPHWHSTVDQMQSIVSQEHFQQFLVSNTKTVDPGFNFEALFKIC